MVLNGIFICVLGLGLTFTWTFLNLQNHKNKRNEKLFNYYAVIKSIEGDRMASVNQISKKLFNDLFETAFILEDEINILIDEKKKKLEESL